MTRFALVVAIALTACSRSDIAAVDCPGGGTACAETHSVPAFRIADMMERFGAVTFSQVPAHDATPAFNPWGSKGDYSSDGVIAAVRYLVGDSGMTMMLREYHFGDDADVRTTNQLTWCPAITAATGSRFIIGPGSGGGSTADLQGLTALATSSTNSGVDWLAYLHGANDPNINSVAPASAIAAQETLHNLGAASGIPTAQIELAIEGIPPENDMAPFANSFAEFNAVHVDPQLVPDLDDGTGRDGALMDQKVAAAMVFGDKPLIISDFNISISASQHRNDPAYNAYFAPIFILSAFTNADARAYMWYALFDYSVDQSAGLFATNASDARPVADVIRAMYTLTGDSGSAKHTFTTGSLDLAVLGLPSPINDASPLTGGHYALFENSSGTYFLYVWNEQIAPGGDTTPVTVQLGASVTSIADYTVTGDASVAQQTARHSSAITIELDASVHLLVIAP
jgi:hypothetical protein